MDMNKIKNNIKIYNSFSRKKELFSPINKKYVGMYVCGPTVYNRVHLGNCRTFISFDLILRYLIHLGYKVRYVRNITDVGHLENNSDEGEDKIFKRSKIEKIEPMEIVQKYTLDFHNILSLFNTISPNIEPVATAHIIEQIEIIKKLIKKKLAYVSNGSVYFNIKKYNENYNYGLLSKNTCNEVILNNKKNSSFKEKKNYQDFALWKKASYNHIMRWPSPWGEGFPGWHIECTAMSTKYLGENFDIHGGGIDLKFPHHECELAQAKGIFGKNYVKYWIHTNMLTFNKKKLSKSTGGILYPQDIFFKKKIHPTIIRFFLLQSHYRSVLNFSKNSFFIAKKEYNCLIYYIDQLKNVYHSSCSTIDIKNWKKNCYKALNDDFNSPLLISRIWESVKFIKFLLEGKEKLSFIDLKIFKKSINNFVFNILGLEKIKKKKNKYKYLIRILMKLRDITRKEKNWKLSDHIRKELYSIGILLKDKKKSSSFEEKIIY